MRPSLRGFSLLEALVVLLIASLLSVLLAQGLAHGLMVRERVLELTQFQREDALRRGWFQDSVRALVADLPRVQQYQFQGSPERFTGLSLAPLQDSPGLPTVVEWRLRAEQGVYTLDYRQQEGPWQVAWAWRAGEAEFAFFDPAIGWTPEWPPANQPAAPALPAAIALRTSWRGDPVTWVAAVRSARTPREGLIPIEHQL